MIAPIPLPRLARLAAIPAVDAAHCQGIAAPIISGPMASDPLTVTVSCASAEPLGDLMLMRGPTTLCTTAVTAASTWACDATFAIPGTYTIDAVQIDVAGNVGNAVDAVPDSRR